MINLGSLAVRRAAFVIFLLFTIPTLWLALRTYGSFQLLRSAYEAGAPETSSIRAWMTLKFVADTYRIPAAALADRLGLPPETDPDSTLKSIATQAGVSPYQYVQRVQHAVAELGAHNGTAGANETSGWLATLGDEVLSAMLVYGYPILGLIQLLGAIGAPVPDGIAGTVAGSLAAQGRMNWIVAGIVIVVASVLGDVIGYGIGRLLSRNFLDRHGRWLGYTPVRGASVERLFARWGLITVFITRTFVSYLSSVTSSAGRSDPLSLVRIRRYRGRRTRNMGLGLSRTWLCHRRRSGGGNRISHQPQWLSPVCDGACAVRIDRKGFT